MKTAKLLFAALLLTGSLGTIDGAMAAQIDEYIEKVPLGLGNYCLEKFPAIEWQTLASNDPALRNNHNAIDYYAPCDASPTGQDQQQQRRLEQDQRFENNFED